MVENNEKLNNTVLDRAGKATGRYKSWYNIRNASDNSVSWTDFSKDILYVTGG